MTPIKTKETNTIFAENQPEYSNLPAIVFGDAEGTVGFVWQLSLKERIKLLLSGKLYHAVSTFGKPL